MTTERGLFNAISITHKGNCPRKLGNSLKLITFCPGRYISKQKEERL
jgi:hypothetical protein